MAIVKKTDKKKAVKNLGMVIDRADNNARSSALLTSEGWDKLAPRIASRIHADRVAIEQSKVAARDPLREMQDVRKGTKANFFDMPDNRAIASPGDFFEVVRHYANQTPSDRGAQFMKRTAENRFKRAPSRSLTMGEIKGWTKQARALSPKSRAIEAMVTDGLAEVANLPDQHNFLNRRAYDVKDQASFDRIAAELGITGNSVEHRFARAYLAKKAQCIMEEEGKKAQKDGLIGYAIQCDSYWYPENGDFSLEQGWSEDINTARVFKTEEEANKAIESCPEDKEGFVKRKHLDVVELYMGKKAQCVMEEEGKEKKAQSMGPYHWKEDHDGLVWDAHHDGLFARVGKDEDNEGVYWWYVAPDSNHDEWLAHGTTYSFAEGRVRCEEWFRIYRNHDKKAQEEPEFTFHVGPEDDVDISWMSPEEKDKHERGLNGVMCQAWVTDEEGTCWASLGNIHVDSENDDYIQKEVRQELMDEALANWKAEHGKKADASLDDLIKEHDRLVKVLESPSHADDLEEAKRQKKELGQYIKQAAPKDPLVDDILGEFPGFKDDTDVNGADLVDFIARWLDQHAEGESDLGDSLRFDFSEENEDEDINGGDLVDYVDRWIDRRRKKAQQEQPAKEAPGQEKLPESWKKEELGGLVCWSIGVNHQGQPWKAKVCKRPGGVYLGELYDAQGESQFYVGGKDSFKDVETSLMEKLKTLPASGNKKESMLRRKFASLWEKSGPYLIRDGKRGRFAIEKADIGYDVALMTPTHTFIGTGSLGQAMKMASDYDKKAQSEGEHVLTHDGKEKFRGTYNECFQQLHKEVGYSADHAMKHEGWDIKPVGKKAQHAFDQDDWLGDYAHGDEVISITGFAGEFDMDDLANFPNKIMLNGESSKDGVEEYNLEWLAEGLLDGKIKPLSGDAAKLHEMAEHVMFGSDEEDEE